MTILQVRSIFLVNIYILFVKDPWRNTHFMGPQAIGKHGASKFLYEVAICSTLKRLFHVERVLLQL